ncbi:MAG: PilW family protein [Pseudomonadota bacterium]
MTSPLRAQVPARSRQAGVTMIELMIAMVVALVLLAALAAMYGSSVKARNEIERTNRQVENGRYAIQLLRDDIQLAGFFGELNMVDVGRTAPPLPGALPDVCVTHLSALPSDGVVDADRTYDAVLDALDYLAVSMHVHVQGFDNVDPAALTGCLAGIDLKPSTDVIVVRRVLTCDAAVGCPFTAGAPHLQASQCSQTGDDEIDSTPFFLAAVADSAVDATFTLRDQNCVADATYNANNTPVRRYMTHIYFIAKNNVGSDGIPTLKRRELISSGWTTTALVEGIEDLQFEYGVDGDDDDSDGTGDSSDQDGAVDEYVDHPASATTATTDVVGWNSVMTVRVHLLSRSTEKRAGYQDSNTYQLGNHRIDASTDLSGDERAYPRKVFETVIHLRNPQGRRL